MTAITPYELLLGDALAMLKTLPEKSVHCVVTSPPYFGLRTYLPNTVKIRADLTAEELQFVQAELKLFERETAC